MTSPDRLVSMANQIGKFFSAQPGENASGAIANHLKKFWDPRMRDAILAHLDAGGAGLDPAVRDAIMQLKQTTTRH
jgi:formate dehydrogenase subunit delta